MNLNKTLGRVATTLVAGAMLTALAMPAYAADYVSSAPHVQFTKTIDMTNAAGATVPNATYEYSINMGEAVPATEDTPEIKAGIVILGQDSEVTAPTINDAEFTSTDSISGSKISKTINVDFKGITFPQPGIYRYVINESDPTVAGLTTDGANTLYLDVYVVDDNGTNKISNYVMLTEAITPTLNENKTTATYGDTKKKFAGNDDDVYTTYELTVKKMVSGPMGDKSVPYSFTINFDDLTQGTMVSTKTVDEDDVVRYVPSEAANADGETSVTASLHHNEMVTISGVPADAVYEVVETLANNSGYTVSYNIDKTEKNTEITGTVGDNSTTYSTGDQNMSADKHDVVVTNFKDAVTPTGIVMNVAPYVLLVVVAAAGCFVFLRKRRED